MSKRLALRPAALLSRTGLRARRPTGLGMQLTVWLVGSVTAVFGLLLLALAWG
jgi:hypothetical protein